MKDGMKHEVWKQFFFSVVIQRLVSKSRSNLTLHAVDSGVEEIAQGLVRNLT